MDFLINNFSVIDNYDKYPPINILLKQNAINILNEQFADEQLTSTLLKAIANKVDYN